MGITHFLAQHILNFFDQTGYLSVFIFMAMESMIFPIPSEAVLPPAGLLIAQGKFTLPMVIIFSTIGSIFGSLLSYWIGRYGGKPFINKFGKYFLLDQEDLEFSEKFFQKHGDITIFICRFIPVVRHLISIPAGLGRMNYVKFALYTIIGAGMWNTILTLVGIKWGQFGWDLIMKYSQPADIIVVGLLLIFIGYFIYKHLKRKVKGQSSNLKSKA